MVFFWGNPDIPQVMEEHENSPVKMCRQLAVNFAAYITLEFTNPDYITNPSLAITVYSFYCSDCYYKIF